MDSSAGGLRRPVMVETVRVTVGGAVDDGYEWDFFVSYTAMDQPWAVWVVWVAWVLEEAGFHLLVQDWDFQTGTNWVAKMDEGVSRTRRTIAVLSEHHARSVYGKAEWQAAWVSDPLGADQRLLVFRVKRCTARSIPLCERSAGISKRRTTSPTSDLGRC
ncbi:toll/interleukin-1 receptor domain-containing protein [Frankia sp. Ag45/Mut15]|uniref:Toll/interleukin-1 receptor domain-containing protein n=1 Tax=Frankia umida TaxID=573489 RepID=A0ABT0JVK4_9ACTN|nr:toll/interleukin-1 receptor domain-containing protein [Frankia umida]MCK9875569.1 toll/interleukin-1 receptor domain-containing protein [Frankia umida]